LSEPSAGLRNRSFPGRGILSPARFPGTPLAAFSPRRPSLVLFRSPGHPTPSNDGAGTGKAPRRELAAPVGRREGPGKNRNCVDHGRPFCRPAGCLNAAGPHLRAAQAPSSSRKITNAPVLPRQPPPYHPPEPRVSQLPAVIHDRWRRKHDRCRRNRQRWRPVQARRRPSGHLVSSGTSKLRSAGNPSLDSSRP